MRQRCVIFDLYVAVAQKVCDKYRVAQKNVPNFRTTLCNRVIKINEAKSRYRVSKRLRTSVKIFT